MDTIQDFEDMLVALEKYEVRYLIIGGLAFIYHAKPRYTKDMDIWIDATRENIVKANHALIEFGSPLTLNPEKKEEILQLGIAPDRIDFLCHIAGVRFEGAWKKRIRSNYGEVICNWIDIDTLIRIKRKIDSPRHQDDVHVLLDVKKRKKRSGKRTL